VITPAVFREVVALAGRAPSLNNSRPWRFRLEDATVLELRVDRARALSCADPQGREAVISCGAALCTLLLALRGRGLQPRVELTPASSDPLLLARVTAQDGPAPTREEQQLLAVVNRRHTERHGFTGDPLDPDLAALLERDVEAEGSALVWVDEPARLAEVVGLARVAEQLRAANPHWRSQVLSRPDLPPDGDLRLPTARFLPDAAPDGLPHPLGRPGRVAVVTTPGDSVLDWVAAGQSLQRMLLRAAQEWVFASYNTAPLENPWLRSAVREALGLQGHPQMLLELGHVTATRPLPALL
jgi:hypothetical protein